MVDGLVGIEEHEGGLVALQEVALGEIQYPSTVDEDEEPNLVVDLGLINSGEELGVSGYGVDLILDVLALEEFLRVEESTDRILRVQSESTSTAQKATTDTSAMFISSCIFSNMTMMSLS